MEQIAGFPLRVKSSQNIVTKQNPPGGGVINAPLYHSGLWHCLFVQGLKMKGHHPQWTTVTHFSTGPTVSVVICEGNSKQIECNNGGSINVVSANYGRLDYDTCLHPSIHSNNCRAENSLAKVQETCQRKTSCLLNASGSIYGDPCPGTYKYLLVEYRCEG